MIRQKNVTSIVFDHKVSLYIVTRKTAPPPWQPYICKTNLFTKFRYDWAKNVTSRETNVLTKFHENWAKIEKMPCPLAAMFFHRSGPFSKLVRQINKTNVLINFHDDWAKLVTSRVFTRKTAPPSGNHLYEDWALNVTSTVFLPSFKLDRDILGTNLLTKFHEDRKINVASRVFTNKCGRTDKDQKTAPSPWQPFLTKFHENWANNVTSRVLTCFHYIHIEKNAPPTGSHVFSPIWTIFELVREINKTNVLTKIVTSRVFTRKTAPPTGSHVFQRT
ncbi:hypothetical protein DPMN_128702 [Dreissena polymorpha]|uniref:Uncharacterized protein n=1 Tax=Dreissena polymorpha TaxID=45954 RepID=A0A9D4JW01_DREPO|nr:hypothetical protein DPMN_128702 [Dreissena polymorpha]